MFATQRKQKIRQFLQAKQTATVSDLSELLQVSQVTVRQDLNSLEEEGFLTRSRGGATLSDRANSELTFYTREVIHAEAKRRIGERAAALVVPGDSIIVDASSTGVHVVRALVKRRDLTDLTIITNGIYTALELTNRPDINTILTGGFLRLTAVSLTGSIAWEMLTNINANKGFFGARGVTPEQGLMEINVLEANVKKKMIERCREVIAVIDSSKFGEVSLISFASLENVHRLITDNAPPSPMLDAFRQRGVEVSVV